MLNAKEQLKIIKKGVDTLINEQELITKLEKSIKSNKPLIVKLGLDPSAPDIHLGHTVVLRKIKQLQDLGHEIIIIIGDFTGRIGDPTGKSKSRVELSREKVIENAKTYLNQIFKILDSEKTKVLYNSDWLSKLHLEDITKLASSITVARMLERNDFRKRYENNTPISLHEFFYPLMQAYDSFEINADIEFGGTDQMFNVLMGRTLQKFMNKEEQVSIFMPILEGLDGVEKMSKSLNNYIGINDDPEVMFKKVMEIPDNLIIRYYELVTDATSEFICKVKDDLSSGKNPRDIKYDLAKTITSLYYNENEVNYAIDYYEKAFSKKDIPDNIPECKLSAEKNTIFDTLESLIDMNLISSKSEFLRLVTQNGVKLNGKQVTKDDLSITLNHGDVLKIGKKRFLKYINI